MRAILLEKYGPPSQLKVHEVPKPTPTENEVLVKIHATAINDYDWSMVRGRPYLYRLLFGLGKPKNSIPGMELSGAVEDVGNKVTLHRKGDAVYGDISEFGFGTLAEYICIHEKAILNKPGKLSFEEAASIPHAYGLAYQGLVEKGQITKGQKVLINGAGGGVGSFGLQIAKLYDAEVTGVDTGDKLNQMKALGFDHIIDYKQQDFTKLDDQYDLILDTKTTHGPFAYARVLKPEGRYITVGGTLASIILVALLGSMVKRFTNKHMEVLALKANKDLDQLELLFTDQPLECVIDGPYPLEEVPRLIQYFGEGKHTGKVIIKMV
ncbi:MAG: NAD(P)-dependent alcohol dehydrogenase [Cyclobacteriaceae bacterium]